MLVCRACGAENPDRARFCLDCGTRLAVVAAAGTSRRTVTILFSDIVGSTELGEQLDPEALRAVLGQYFATMRAAVERHGGTVEKFIGDAVMAVFGLAAIHEDDALRAVRAAAEMREALAELNMELRARRGITIAARTGLNTGSVAAGDPSTRETMVTGDTVNTAARLEQAAGPGEILLGLATWQLVRHAVTVEPVAALPAKGKAEPVSAVRLVAVSRGVERRPAPAAAMVGRREQLQQLVTAFDDVVATRRPALITVLGAAGVGKSRLTDEFVAAVAERANVLRGHCLPYGEGITYWPIREILHAAAGIRDGDSSVEGTARLGRVLVGIRDRSAIVARLASLIGLSAASFTQTELFWAVRRAIEQLAHDRPLVLVIDDIHWAEPTLLDLIDSLVERARDVPLLVLCPAREELLEGAPDRAAPGPRATVIRLDGLPAEVTAALIDALPGGATIKPELRERIVATVDGNPLFLEEMVRLVVEDGAAAGSLPPTIQALLAARVDGLPLPERGVAQRASVAGRIFEEVAVVALTPAAARPEITTSLLGLVRREVVTPERSQLTLEDAYRFRHILLRDAAYEALAKVDRADLHRRFADWLEQAAGDRLMEYEEILGHHLGQAYRYRVDLRENDATTLEIGGRAARYLGASGKRAADRGDGNAAVRLLDQATALPSDDQHAHVRWLVELALALQGVGRTDHARARVDEALRLALALGDRGLAARARVALVDLRQADGTVVAFDPAIRSEIALALDDADASGDHLAMADAEDALARAAWNEGAESESETHTRLAIQHATMAGEIRFALATELNLLVGVFAGATPASEVAAQAMALSERAAEYPTVRAEAISLLAISEAMLGRFEDAHRHLDESIALLIDLGAASSLVNVRTYKAWIHRLADEWPAAEAVLRDALAEADAMGDLGFKSFVSCRLAEVLVAEERYEEATAALAVAERSPVAATRSRISGARARIKAARGDPMAKQEIEPLLAMAQGWPWPNVRAEAFRDAAYVMRALADRDAARQYATEAARLSRAKENVALAAQMDAFVATL